MSQETLFGIAPPKEKVRTLGFYQPFGSLMLHGKIETRWVREGKKPPFPLGKYLFYNTQRGCEKPTLFQWCGPEIMLNISGTLANEPTRILHGAAIAIGELKEVRPLTKEDEPLAFVKYVGRKTETIEKEPGEYEQVTKVQWALVFENVQRISPFLWPHGKQGIGFVPDELISKIKLQP